MQLKLNRDFQAKQYSSLTVNITVNNFKEEILGKLYCKMQNNYFQSHYIFVKQGS